MSLLGLTNGPRGVKKNRHFLVNTSIPFLFSFRRLKHKSPLPPPQKALFSDHSTPPPPRLPSASNLFSPQELDFRLLVRAW